MKNLLFILLSFVLVSACSSSKEAYIYKNEINPENIEIYRDEHGVPHIFAETDAEVAYGLAWANAEDAFDWMQESLLAGSDLMARYMGKDGAAVDFFNHFIGAEKLVEERFEEDISPEALKYIEGYCQGVNAFAAKHPEKVLMKKLFPTTPKKVLQSYVVSMSFLVGASDPIQKLLDGDFPLKDQGLGSNAYAFSSTKTVNDETFLCINPHFYADGPLSFYEAHLNSNEGLNFHGALFHGMMSVVMGNNENLGYGMTYNHFDAVDVFKLKMDANKKHTYQIDGESFKLEKRKVWLKVKIGKFLVLPVPRTTYWSEIGPVLKSKDGNYYAVRFWANRSLKLVEQLLKMNKSQNLEQFKEALDIRALGMFNIVYADKEDNIYYVCYGQIPNRNVDDKRDFNEVLEAYKQDQIWQDILEVEEMPHVVNPTCGYIFNANNNPFNTTCETENDDASRLHKGVNLRNGENSRSERLRELIASQDTFSFEAFKAMKFDTKFPKSNKFLESIDFIKDIDATQYPDIEKPIQWIQNWNREVTNESVEAAWYARAFKYVFANKEYTDERFIFGLDINEADFIEAVRQTKENFEKNFGKLEVTKGELMRIKRNDKDFPDPGFPDLLAASYGKDYGDGTLVPEFSDSYTHFIRFDETGPKQIQTLTVFGPSSDTTNERSTIAMERYSKQQPKTMSLKRTEIVLDEGEIYHPK